MKQLFYIVVNRKITSPHALNNGEFVEFLATDPTPLAWKAKEQFASLFSAFGDNEDYQVKAFTKIIHETVMEVDSFQHAFAPDCMEFHN